MYTYYLYIIYIHYIYIYIFYIHKIYILYIHFLYIYIYKKIVLISFQSTSLLSPPWRMWSKPSDPSSLRPLVSAAYPLMPSWSAPRRSLGTLGIGGSIDERRIFSSVFSWWILLWIHGELTCQNRWLKFFILSWAIFFEIRVVVLFLSFCSVQVIYTDRSLWSLIISWVCLLVNCESGFIEDDQRVVASALLRIQVLNCISCCDAFVSHPWNTW